VEFKKIQQPAEGHSVDVCPSKLRTLVNWNNKLEILGHCCSCLLMERGAVCVFYVPEVCAELWSLYSDIAKFFGARARLSRWPSLIEL